MKYASKSHPTCWNYVPYNWKITHIFCRKFIYMGFAWKHPQELCFTRRKLVWKRLWTTNTLSALQYFRVLFNRNMCIPVHVYLRPSDRHFLMYSQAILPMQHLQGGCLLWKQEGLSFCLNPRYKIPHPRASRYLTNSMVTDCCQLRATSQLSFKIISQGIQSLTDGWHRCLSKGYMILRYEDRVKLFAIKVI